MNLEHKIQLALQMFNLAVYLGIFIAAGTGMKFLIHAIRCHTRRYSRQQSLWSNWT